MKDWVSSWTHEKSFDFLDEVSGLLGTMGGPLTKDLAQLIHRRQFVELVNYQFDYTGDFPARDYFLARQVHALLQKQEWLDLGLEPRKKGEEKFWEMEKRCSKTNDTLDSRQLTAGAWQVVHLARQKVARILGGVPSLEQLTFSFGPGANTTVKGNRANAVAKLWSSLACSRDSLPVVADLLAQVPYWAWCSSGLPPRGLSKMADMEMADRIEQYLFAEGYLTGPILPPTSRSVLVDIITHAGKLDFVPKDARSLRSIIVEPVLNGLAQKGIGTYLKSRMLRSVGLDLRDQNPNSVWACKGSLDGSIATVDLSSASDTVSWSLVALLLPDSWVDFLGSWRTGEIQVGDKTVELHKFSSMGNAFTFELESLLFYAITSSVVDLLGLKHDVRVFGDDIICPTDAYPRLEATLVELGFLVNSEKSFCKGPFRESCGADWLNGESIRPYYAKKAWSERTLYTFHNFAVRNCEPELAALLLSWTDPALRLFGPDGVGDGHLLGSYSPRTNRKTRRAYGPGGGFIDTYSDNPKRINNRKGLHSVLPSYSVYTRSSVRDYYDPNIVRGSDGYAKVSLYTFATSIFGRELASPEASQVVGLR
jgi:hypothetical protein